jgi:hypothetical protein
MRNNGAGGSSPSRWCPLWCCRWSSGCWCLGIDRSVKILCSKGGFHSEGEGRLVEILSPALFLATVWLLLALLWRCWGFGDGAPALAVVCGRCLYRSSSGDAPVSVERCRRWSSRTGVGPSFGRWVEGGGFGLPNPGCGELGEVPRLMCYKGSIGSVLGGPPLQLLKPGWAMVLRRVLCRRSSAVCGEDGVCSLTRDLCVFFLFLRVFLHSAWPRVFLVLSSGICRACVVLFLLE